MKPQEKARIQGDRKWLEERQRVQSYDELMRSYAKEKGGCEGCVTVDADIRWGETDGLLCRECAVTHWTAQFGGRYETDRQRLLAFESFWDDNFEQIAIFHCSLCREGFVGLTDEVSATFRTWHRCFRDQRHPTLIRQEAVRLYQCIDCSKQIVKKSGTQCDDCRVSMIMKEMTDAKLAREKQEWAAQDAENRRVAEERFADRQFSDMVESGTTKERFDRVLYHQNIVMEKQRQDEEESRDNASQ